MAHTDPHIRVGYQLVENDQGEPVGVLWETGSPDQPDAVGYTPVGQRQPGEKEGVDPWT